MKYEKRNRIMQTIYLDIWLIGVQTFKRFASIAFSVRSVVHTQLEEILVNAPHKHITTSLRSCNRSLN